MSNPFQIGDPVMDAAQGRPMVVLDAPDETVAEWSDRNGYDLLDNYSNSKFDPEPGEAVVECAYVSDVRSEPSKTYTFPTSRVCLIDAHHADSGRRVYERVMVDVLSSLLSEMDGANERSAVLLAAEELYGYELVDVARELDDIERTMGAE